MCEWLTHSQWCDVKVFCGGHSFNAHRAVLASVSTFLRRILLACPVDEAPTYIVLPDFDLEAMSSVLYYIYNGEVILQKNKISSFLDIIQALQIYVDCQYLPKLRKLVEKGSFDWNLSYDANNFKSDIFTLGFYEDKDQPFFNIRKGTELQSVLLEYSQRETDFRDNIVRCQNESELRRSRLGNLKSPYGDRQRNSFLRDLFIETYPRNGNVNGQTEGVLAISNECYRAPASVLSTNANGEHLGSDDEIAKICSKTTRQALTSAFHPIQQLQHTNNYSRKCMAHRKSNGPAPYVKCPTNINEMTFNYDNSGTTPEFSTGQISLLPNQLQDMTTGPGSNVPLDFQQSFLQAMQTHFLKGSQYSMAQSSFLSCIRGEKQKDLQIQSSSKVIFNQVLENPWSPRKPNNFRPFRRKDQHTIENLQVEKNPIINDDNNNIQKPLVAVMENLTNRASLNDKLTESIVPLVPICTDTYKCSHCHQVFTSSESLAVHMRRHSTTARYTCGECGKTFSQLRNFKYHMSIHRGTREFAATCTVCGKYFNDRGYLSSHMKIHRNRKEYKCTLCPKSFNQRVAYNMHVRIHTGVKPHVCEVCGKAFSRKMLLKQHQRTHSGERPYACPHCDKRFADRSNMTLHLRLHTGVKPFSCSLCPKSFTKKHHLKSHLNFHTGSKPYSCPRCKLAFTQSSNMRTHYKKCSVPDPSNDQPE